MTGEQPIGIEGEFVEKDDLPDRPEAPDTRHRPETPQPTPTHHDGLLRGRARVAVGVVGLVLLWQALGYVTATTHTEGVNCVDYGQVGEGSDVVCESYDTVPGNPLLSRNPDFVTAWLSIIGGISLTALAIWPAWVEARMVRFGKAIGPYEENEGRDNAW